MTGIRRDRITGLLSLAGEAALKAGAYLRDSDHSAVNINSEAGRDIKIGADIASENIIISCLKKRSGFSILSEEAGSIEGSDREFTWIVDPLDGSLNYSRGIPLCCVSIGLWHEMEPVAGVVYDFYRSELFTGIAGREGGAWLNGKAIAPGAAEKQASAVICTGFPVNTDFSAEGLMPFLQKVQKYKKVRLLGSAALSLAYVSSGRADVYMEDNIMIWDVAGGLAVASGAGCKLDIGRGIKKNSMHVAVSNGSFTI
jgi:fructose-1,6-bisphosphatase/inositol monophosphatase family enzyme